MPKNVTCLSPALKVDDKFLHKAFEEQPAVQGIKTIYLEDRSSTSNYYVSYTKEILKILGYKTILNFLLTPLSIITFLLI